MSPMLLFWTDLVYLVISAAVAFWVGWTFHRNGRVFLLEVFHHQEERADSVNHLILEGFYLISIGFVAVAIRISAGAGLQDMSGAIQVVSTKVGLVLLVLGVTHFLSLMMFSRMRWRVRLVENQDKKEEEKFEIGSAGEPLGYTSLDQATVLAIQNAGESTDFYGRRYASRELVREVVSTEEGWLT